ncbi:MAG: 23S rRNA (guanosine(2251)-2'-O)-methyltransferase RlmB [Mycoplasmataceae bacterium]|nr:23S rRNA (guanosine(2251)-2'-O)-methyltransferase RlmB [Mycoplasmataceae bacterium]
MTQQLFGRKVLLENINNNQIINVDLAKQNRDLIPLLKKHHINFQLRDNNFFKNYDLHLNHQGIVINMKNNQIKDLTSLITFVKNKPQSIVLIIDGIQDPQNFGSILRTCDAMQVDGVIYKKDNQAQINDFVSKTSMGAVQYLNLVKVTNLHQVLDLLKNIGYWIYASTLSNDAIDYQKIKYDYKSIIIVGNEEKGISPLLKKTADFQIKIPMYGKIQSLNVSVATGVILAEIKRQFRIY